MTIDQPNTVPVQSEAKAKHIVLVPADDVPAVGLELVEYARQQRRDMVQDVVGLADDLVDQVAKAVADANLVANKQ